MLSHKTRTMTCSILFGLCLVTATQANAQTAQVKYRPYELTSSAGTRVVAERIDRTVRRVCRPHATPIQRDRRACIADLSHQLLAKINSPVLTAQWTSAYGTGRG